MRVHGQGLRVEALSRGPGALTVSMRDGEGTELAGASLGAGRWDRRDARATDVWLLNESSDVVTLDVWAGGGGTVAVSTLAAPVKYRTSRGSTEGSARSQLDSLL